jgi:hypothetical protein
MPGKLIPGEKKTPIYKKSAGFKMKSSLDKLLKETDMSKLRSKQARSSKGISEYQHFSKKGTQGDEPIVEGTWGGKKKK